MSSSAKPPGRARKRGNAGSKASAPAKEQSPPESAWSLPRKPVPTEAAPLAGKKGRKQAPEASSSSEKTGPVPKTGDQAGMEAEAQPPPKSKGLPSGPGNVGLNVPGRAQQPSGGEIPILDPAGLDPKQTKPTGKVPPPTATTSQSRQAVPSFSLPRPLFGKNSKDTPNPTEPPPPRPLGIGSSGPMPPIPDQTASASSSKQPPISEPPRTGPPGAAPPLPGTARSGPSLPLPSRPGQPVPDAPRPGTERQGEGAQGNGAGFVPEQPGPAPSFPLPKPTKSPRKKPSDSTLPADQGFPAPLRLGNSLPKGPQKAGAAAGVLPQKNPTGPNADQELLAPLRFGDPPPKGPQKTGAAPGASSQKSTEPNADQKGGTATALTTSGPAEQNRSGIGRTQQSQKPNGAPGLIARKPVNPFGSPPPVEPTQMGEPPSSLPPKLLPTETPGSLRSGANPLQPARPNAPSQPGNSAYMNSLRSSPPNPALQSDKPTGMNPLRSPPSKRPIQTGVPPGAHPLQSSPPSTLSQPGNPAHMNPLRSSPPNPSLQPGHQDGYRTSVYRPSMPNAPPQKQDTATFVPFRPPNGEPAKQMGSSNAVPPRVTNPPGPRPGPTYPGPNHVHSNSADSNMSKDTATSSATATSSRPLNLVQRQNTGLVSKPAGGHNLDLEKGTPGGGGVGEYYSGEAGAPPPTPYTNMLLSLDKIPRRHNILVLLFVWILLAGFVILPGSFTSAKRKQDGEASVQVPAGGGGGKLSLTPANTAALVIGFVCIVAGAFGSAWLALRWRRNYVWLLNKLYMPLILDALAGLLATVIGVYTQQAGEWSSQAIVAAILEGGILGLSIILFLLYNYWLLRRIRGDDLGEGMGYGKEKKKKKKRKDKMGRREKKEEKERRKREKRERKERKKWEKKEKKGKKIGGGFFARFGKSRKMPPVTARKFV